MFKNEYLLNPFNLQYSTDEELSNAINERISQYRHSDLAVDVAFNISLEADLLVIYGEFIARLQEEVSIAKLENDNRQDMATYQLRKDWLNTNSDKAPAMSYFEAQAKQLVLEDRKKQYKKDAMLTRFKKSYDSLETKQNALKKKLEAMKYEVV